MFRTYTIIITIIIIIIIITAPPPAPSLWRVRIAHNGGR